MTEIRVDLDSPHTEMRGFAAASLTDKTPFSSPRPPFPSPPRDPVAGSLHSEPDIDTIMPLSGSRLASFKSDRNGPSSKLLLSVEHEDGDSDDSSEWYSDSGRQAPTQNPTSIGFTSVEHPMFGHDVFGDDLTANALESCKKKVLHPYLGFLKVIGWRRFHPKRYDLQLPKWLAVVNVVWPTFVCLLIFVSCITQIFTCFRRDALPTAQKTITTHYPNNTSNDSCGYEINCKSHLMTTFIIPDLLLISAFAYGLYIFRWVQTEQLSTLTETVFLGHINRHGRFSHRRLTTTLQLLIFVGLFWILFSLCNSLLRAYVLQLVARDTKIDFIQLFEPNNSLVYRWILVSFTIIGFIVLDIAYIAVVVNYCIQCQLLVYLLWSIGERMKAREWDIDQSIKEIRNGRDFLSQLNSHLSRATSLLLFIFIASSIQAIYGFYNIDDDDYPLVGVLGLLASLQWTFMLALPLIQASRVTRACTKLKKSAAEVRSRPYNYKDTPQLDLDSLLTFTSGLNMSAKLVSVPMSPALVVAGFFIGGLAFFLLFQFDDVKWTVWI